MNITVARVFRVQTVRLLMFIGPCIIVIIEELDVTCYFISLLMYSTCVGH